MHSVQTQARFKIVFDDFGGSISIPFLWFCFDFCMIVALPKDRESLSPFRPPKNRKASAPERPLARFWMLLGAIWHQLVIKIVAPRKRIFCNKYQSGALFSPLKASSFCTTFASNFHGVTGFPSGPHLFSFYADFLPKSPFWGPLGKSVGPKMAPQIVQRGQKTTPNECLFLDSPGGGET